MISDYNYVANRNKSHNSLKLYNIKNAAAWHITCGINKALSFTIPALKLTSAVYIFL